MVSQYCDSIASMKQEMLETIEHQRQIIMQLKSQKTVGLKNDQQLFKISTMS